MPSFIVLFVFLIRARMSNFIYFIFIYFIFLFLSPLPGILSVRGECHISGVTGRRQGILMMAKNILPYCPGERMR